MCSLTMCVKCSPLHHIAKLWLFWYQCDHNVGLDDNGCLLVCAMLETIDNRSSVPASLGLLDNREGDEAFGKEATNNVARQQLHRMMPSDLLNFISSHQMNWNKTAKQWGFPIKSRLCTTVSAGTVPGTFAWVHFGTLASAHYGTLALAHSGILALVHSDTLASARSGTLA